MTGTTIPFHLGIGLPIAQQTWLVRFHCYYRLKICTARLELLQFACSHPGQNKSSRINGPSPKLYDIIKCFSIGRLSLHYTYTYIYSGRIQGETLDDLSPLLVIIIIQFLFYFFFFVKRRPKQFRFSERIFLKFFRQFLNLLNGMLLDSSTDCVS